MLRSNIIQPSDVSGGGVHTNDLRYLIYLSRNNAWVMIDDEPYQLELRTKLFLDDKLLGNLPAYSSEEGRLSPRMVAFIRSTATEAIGTQAIFGRNNIRLDALSAEQLKTELCKSDNYEFAAKDIATWEGVEAKFVSDLNLNHVEKNALILVQGRKNDFNMYIYTYRANFDAVYGNEAGRLVSVEHNDQEEKRQHDIYKFRKAEACMDAKRNAIWLAAASGDNTQLSLLLKEYTDVDLKSAYLGKTIIQAMFDADPEVDFPFKTGTPNYGAVIDLLVQHGLKKLELINTSNQYIDKQNGLWFFQRSNPMHLKMFNIIKEKIGESASFERTADNVSKMCNVM